MTQNKNKYSQIILDLQFKCIGYKCIGELHKKDNRYFPNIIAYSNLIILNVCSCCANTACPVAHPKIDI
jgi:hypothetical protein